MVPCRNKNHLVSLGAFCLSLGSAQIDVKTSFKGRQPNKESATKPLCRYVSPGHGPAYEKERHYVTYSVDEMVWI
jgi:hypothetical protein